MTLIKCRSLLHIRVYLLLWTVTKLGSTLDVIKGGSVPLTTDKTEP